MAIDPRSIMQLDPNMLQRLGNPTGGKLTQLGQMYQQNQQNQLANRVALQEAAQAKQKMKILQDEAQRAQALDDAQTLYSLSSSYLDAVENDPSLAIDPEKYGQWMKSNTQMLSPRVTSSLRGKMPPDIKTIRDRTRQYLKAKGELDDSNDLSKWELIAGIARIDPNDRTEEQQRVYDAFVTSGAEGTGSEFERHLSWLKQNDPTFDQAREKQLREKRVGTRAGTDLTEYQEITEGRRQNKDQRDAVTDLRDEYVKGVSTYKSMLSNIESAKTAMDAGNIGLADTMMAQALSQVKEGGDVRAFAMFQQFDKSYGNVVNRTIDAIERWFTGRRTPEARAEIRDALNYMAENYAEPRTNQVRDRYRAIALEDGLDPFAVVPPTSLEDIRESTLIDEDRKLELMRLHPELSKPFWNK